MHPAGTCLGESVTDRGSVSHGNYRELTPKSDRADRSPAALRIRNRSQLWSTKGWTRGLMPMCKADFRTPDCLVSTGTVPMQRRKTLPRRRRARRSFCERRIAGATSWSPLQPILSPAPTEPLAASFEDSVPPPAVLPVAGGGADAGGDLSAESAHDLREPGGSVQPKSQLSRLQIQKTKRAKREAREVQRKSVQQCEQLHSDQAECRLQLDRAATGSDRHGQPLPKLSTSAH